MSPAERLARQMQFLIEVDRLKEVLRQTHCTQSRRRENDAEHSWHLALFALTLAEHSATPLDVNRVVRMALLHDLVEIDAGDTFAYDAQRAADQHAREEKAAERLFGLLPPDQADEFRAVWDEFEARTTPEARFAAAIDRLQPMLLNSLTEGAAWRRNGVTATQVRHRAETIRSGSTALFEEALRRIDDAVRHGHLPE